MEPERITEFQDVTAATARVLSENSELVVCFKPGDLGAADHKVFIDRPSTLDLGMEIDRIRGQADVTALRLRYHDDKLTTFTQPGNAQTHALFKLLEQTRCDCLGARRFDGVANNLQAHFRDQYGHNPLSGTPDEYAEQLPIAIVMLAREMLGGMAPPPEALEVFISWRQWLTPHLEYFHSLAESLQDQENFARHVWELLAILGFPGIESNNTDAELINAPAEVQSNSLDGCSDAAEEIGNDAATRASFGPLQESLSSASLPGDDTEQPVNDATDGIPLAVSGKGFTQCPDYRIFTDEFDEIVDAGSLCEYKELVRLRNRFDEHISRLNNIVGRLASRLQRRLLAKQNLGWEFDLEEGVLDTSRLTRVIVNPLNTLSFKREKEIELQDTIVTCLIDNSGSMRGRPILLAAISADMIARTLERCGVKVEILGFTTRAWKGGQARIRWLADGRPSQPGRLNDLRHIVYKSADTPWRRAKLGIGLMLREGLLKENIDGEALTWAYTRLRSRFERRKILIVISDGAPVDDATLSANSASFLEQHLRQVIAEIESSGHVELSAVGIGHDVTRYYRRALTLVDADQLGGAITDELVELLDPSTDNRKGKR